MSVWFRRLAGPLGPGNMPVRSWEALKESIGKGVERFQAVADYVGVQSHSTVYKWTQPYSDRGSGNKNPLQIVQEIMELSLADGMFEPDALAPVIYLAEQFGLIVIPAPTHLVSAGNLSQDLLKTIKEFSDLTQASAAALADNKITRTEAQEINKEGNELIRQVATYLEHIQAVTGEPPGASGN